jgi:hypothetical protein
MQQLSGKMYMRILWKTNYSKSRPFYYWCLGIKDIPIHVIALKKNN